MYPDTVHAIGGKVQTQNPDDTSMPRENIENLQGRKSVPCGFTHHFTIKLIAIQFFR
jgi:hypothetical protein